MTSRRFGWIVSTALSVAVSFWYPCEAQTIQVVPIEVAIENLVVREGIKTIYVGNDNAHFVLFCKVDAYGCITPKKRKKYWLVDENTNWVRPGATKPITLAAIQEFTLTYNQGKNYGLVAEDDGEKDAFGMFILDTNQGGYERDIIYSDGPIYYGANMNEKDRSRVWKNLTTQIMHLAAQQKGEAGLSSMLAQRCVPNQPFCTVTLEAEMAGIRGIKEPRKVELIVGVDSKDTSKHVFRTICTWPEANIMICRDWKTGKLQTEEFEKAQ